MAWDRALLHLVGLADSSAPVRLPAERFATQAIPLISIVIVNHRQWADTALLATRCMHSAPGRRGDVEVIIVDNHSPIDSVVPRLRRTPGVSVRRWKRNRGFARAVNEGCRLSRGRWLLLLNPDISLRPRFMEDLIQFIECSKNRADLGVVGFQLQNSDGTLQGSAGHFPTLFGTLARLLLPRSTRKYLRPLKSGSCQVPWVTGCCLLMNRDCFSQVGGFDEDFFLYYEDVDFCRRATDQGWSVWYESGLMATHYRPLHSRKIVPPLHLCTRHALLTYASKHWPRWQLLFLTALIRLEAQLKRIQARFQAHRDAAGCYAELAPIASAICAGQSRTARRRLDHMVSHAQSAARAS